MPFTLSQRVVNAACGMLVLLSVMGACYGCKIALFGCWSAMLWCLASLVGDQWSGGGQLPQSSLLVAPATLCMCVCFCCMLAGGSAGTTGLACYQAGSSIAVAGHWGGVA